MIVCILFLLLSRRSARKFDPPRALDKIRNQLADRLLGVYNAFKTHLVSKYATKAVVTEAR